VAQRTAFDTVVEYTAAYDAFGVQTLSSVWHWWRLRHQ
jgi:hypothetical protein